MSISPHLPFPERGRTVVDVQLAQNTRRRGPLQAEEGLGWEPSYAGAFHESVMKTDDAANHARYETQRAGQEFARGRLGSGQEIPAWALTDQATRAGFWQGTDGTEQSVTVRPKPWQARASANPNTITPLHGLLAGERPGAVYQIAASGQGGRRRNEADVTDL